MDDIDFEELDRAVDEMMRKENKKLGRQETEDLDSEEMAQVDGEMSVKAGQLEKPVVDKNPKIELKNRPIAEKPGVATEKPTETTAEEDQYKAKINTFLRQYKSTSSESQTEKTEPEDSKLEDSATPIITPKPIIAPKAELMEAKPAPSPVVIAPPVAKVELEKPKEEAAKEEPVADSEAVAVKVIKSQPKPIKKRPTGRFMDFVNKPIASDDEPVVPHSVQQLERAKRAASMIRPAKPIQSIQPATVANDSVVAKPKPQPQTPPAPVVEPIEEEVKPNLADVVEAGDAETSELERAAKQETTDQIGKVTNVDDLTSEEVQVFEPHIDLEPSPARKTDQEPLRSPFIEQAKVKKRPLGNPELAASAPTVTMDVPDRITRLHADEDQTALYRSELRVDPSNRSVKSSNWGWIVVLFILLAALVTVVYFFFNDLKTLFV